MKIKQAIEKSIEGGWKPIKDTKYDDNSYEALITRHGYLANLLRFALLDPSFWQSLGKVLGWELACSDCLSSKGYNEDGCLSCFGERERTESEEWDVRWHFLLYNLASGRTIESYFENL